MNAALVRVFLGRFFENEITGGSNDLRQSFFWLISFLAAPGIGMPVLMAFTWDGIGRFGGVVMLDLISRADKVLYLGYAMLAPSIVCAIVWESLLIDRRDALVLGVLPVRPAAIVRAKLAALGIYVSAIAVGMHALASIAWGLLLGMDGTFVFALRSIAAHFVASCAASLFVVCAIVGVQGAALAIAGPRLFARASAALHLGLVVTIGVGIFFLPTISTSAVTTLVSEFHLTYAHVRFGTYGMDAALTGHAILPWILRTPPMWFLGVYERLLGATDASIGPLGWRAVWALAAGLAVAVGSYSIAYRRVMVRMVEEGEGFRRTGHAAVVVRAMTRLVVWHPRSRAIVEFVLLTTARVDRHRFALAVGLGAALAWVLPTASHWIARWPFVPSAPQVDLLTLPLSLMLVVLVGLRVAAALPADLKAAWIFEDHPPSDREVRSVMERLMLAAGVLPFVVAFLPLHWWLWGARVAWTHVVFALALGWLMIQMLLRHFHGVPCAAPWRPERADLRFRGPIYLIVFLWFAAGMYIRHGDALEIGVLQFPPVLVFSLVIFLGPAIILRWNATHEPPPPPEEDALGAVSVLHLE